MASSNTVLQLIVDDNKRGRMMSFFTMAFMGVAPFGSLLAGGLAGWLGAPRAVMIGGILCLAGAYIFGKDIMLVKSELSGLNKDAALEIKTGIGASAEISKVE